MTLSQALPEINRKHRLKSLMKNRESLGIPKETSSYRRKETAAKRWKEPNITAQERHL